MIKHFSATTILAGVGACSVLLFAPIAGADDLPCEQQPPEQQQQCQQQKNQGAGIANKVIDNVQQGMDRAGLVKPMIDPQTGKLNPGPVGVRALVNGVDTCMPAGTPLPFGADVRIVPGDMTGHCILGG